MGEEWSDIHYLCTKLYTKYLKRRKEEEVREPEKTKKGERRQNEVRGREI